MEWTMNQQKCQKKVFKINKKDHSCSLASFSLFVRTGNALVDIWNVEDGMNDNKAYHIRFAPGRER